MSLDQISRGNIQTFEVDGIVMGYKMHCQDHTNLDVQDPCFFTF